MEKIQMKTPLVEMDGDEMTRILWQYIKDELLTPFIDLNTEYYDLGLEYRDKTNDQVTVDAAEATKKYGVAVKCATITANAARVKEYGLKEMWKSPNGTIRAILDGTVFRSPIVVKGIEPCVKNWKKPITLARHAYGDVYKNAELRIPGAGEVKLVYTPTDGSPEETLSVHAFEGPGVVQGQYNLDDSIIEYIAKNIKSNIRELEGSLNKIIAYANLEKREVTMELAETVLKDIISPNDKKIITPEYIINTVAEHYDITPEDIIGTKRNSKVVYPRQIAMYLCRELANIPLKSIGQCMGNRDHTTIMHGCDKIEQELKTSQTTQKAIEILKKKLQPGN